MAKKGDYCAVSIRHSSTYVNGRMEANWSWHIGRVHKASRNGETIREVIVPRSLGTGTFEDHKRGYDCGSWWNPLHISAERQAQAATLIGQEFNSVDALKAAFPCSH